MNYGPLVFFGAFLALISSWFGFVLTPQLQVGQLQQTNTLGAGVTYPVARTGMAQQGLAVYRANGCATCHSQQTVQSGTVFDVLLTDAGTNQPLLFDVLRQFRPALSDPDAILFVSGLPKEVIRYDDRAKADAAVKAIKAAGGAKATLWVVPIGPDMARGWGKRRTVAEDFLMDNPVLLGNQRIGPDLANAGVRLPDVNWHLRHLYAPASEVKGSTMPAYKFMFQVRKASGTPHPDALRLSGDFAPPAGYEVVPKEEARALAAYLISLKADAPLFTSPLSVASAPPPPTATNAPATNAPAQKP